MEHLSRRVNQARYGDAVSPAAVGVDIGCGMSAVRTSLTAADLPDDLSKLRRRIESAVPVGFGLHKTPVNPAKVHGVGDCGTGRAGTKRYESHLHSAFPSFSGRTTPAYRPRNRYAEFMKRLGLALSMAAAGLVLAGCSEITNAVDQTNKAANKVSACAEALSLVDLNPDPATLKERAADKEKRLRELATSVGEQNVATALTGMADSYLQVQKENIQDVGKIADWTARNLQQIDTLRKVCA